jgi:hypothetical protein
MSDDPRCTVRFRGARCVLLAGHLEAHWVTFRERFDWRREIRQLTVIGVAEIIAITLGLIAAMAILFCRGG